MSELVRILIVGTGHMAQSHADAYRTINDALIVGAVDTNKNQLGEFCERNSIKNEFTSVEDAIDWGKFDAVSNVTPDSAHYPTTLPLIEAHKHVLCEKPLALSYQQAKELADKANHEDIIHLLNLTYRAVPAVQKAAQLVSSGEIGNIRHFEASYLQSWLTQSAWGDWKSSPQWLWRLSTEHGSNGVLGDVGIHIIDFATFVMGQMPVNVSSKMHTFDKMPSTSPKNQIGKYSLDANDSFVMCAQLSNGALGTIAATRFASGHHNDLRLRLYGDEGGMEVLFENNESRLNVCIGDNLKDAIWEEIDCPEVPSNYHRFVNAIQNKGEAGPDFYRGAELQSLINKLLRDESASF